MNTQTPLTDAQVFRPPSEIDGDINGQPEVVEAALARKLEFALRELVCALATAKSIHSPSLHLASLRARAVLEKGPA